MLDFSQWNISSREDFLLSPKLLSFPYFGRRITRIFQGFKFLNIELPTVYNVLTARLTRGAQNKTAIFNV